MAGVSPRAPSRPPDAPTSASRWSTSAGVSSPSQPMPKIAPSTAGAWGLRASRAAAARSSASQSGLARPGSSP
jgi:hypothetical protein